MNEQLPVIGVRALEVGIAGPLGEVALPEWLQGALVEGLLVLWALPRAYKPTPANGEDRIVDLTVMGWRLGMARHGQEEPWVEAWDLPRIQAAFAELASRSSHSPWPAPGDLLAA